MSLTNRIGVMLLVLLALILSPLATAAPADDAAKAYANGQELLKKGDFDGAKKAFALAAKTDPEKVEYRQHYSILSRVIKIRESLDKEQNPARWATSAKALRSFYLSNRLYDNALALSKKMYDKLNTADSAVALAEIQLKLNQNDAAAKFLGALPEKQISPQTQVLLALALAREGKTDKAGELVKKITVPTDAAPNMLYSLAGVYARVGDSAKSTVTLTKAFESTPPNQVDAYRKVIRSSKDFASIAAKPEFEKALKTETKVKASACSGGSECGKCPSRGSCGGQKSASCQDAKDCPEKK